MTNRQRNKREQSIFSYAYITAQSRLKKMLEDQEKRLILAQQRLRQRQRQRLGRLQKKPSQSVSVKSDHSQQQDIFQNFQDYIDQSSQEEDQQKKNNSQDQSKNNQLQTLAQMESQIGRAISMILETKQILFFSDQSLIRHQASPQYLCSTQGCKYNPTICLNEKCKCSDLHKKCLFIPFNTFLSQLLTKVNKKQPQKFVNYMSLKKHIVQHMIDRISQERNIIQQWEQSLQNTNQQKSCYIFGLSKQGISRCLKPRVTLNFQQTKKMHGKCFCEHIKLINPVISEVKKKEFKKIYEVYAHILDFLEERMQQIRQIQTRSYCLNYAEIQILKFFLSCNNSSIFKEKNQLYFTGNTVFYAKNLNIINKSYYHFDNDQDDQQLNQWQRKRRQQKKLNTIMISSKIGLSQTLNLQYYYFAQKKTFEPFSMQYLKQKWNVFCHKIFNSNIQASALTNLQLLPKHFNKIINHKDHLKAIENQLQGIFDQFDDLQKSKDKKLKIVTFDLSSLKKFIGQNEKIFKKINLSNLKGINYCLNYGILKQKKDMKQIILTYLSKLQKINQIHYSKYSNYELLEQICQNASFINRNGVQAQSKSDFLSSQEIIQLCESHSSKLINSKIKNVHIGQISNKKCSKVFTNLGYSLKQLSIGMKMFDGLQYTDSKLIQQVFNIYSLKNFVLIGNFQYTKAMRQMLIKLISQNKHLKCLVIDTKIDDDLINNEVLQQIKKSLPKIQKLVIRNCNSELSTSAFGQLKNLKILDLSNCKNILPVEFSNTLMNLKNITHLVLEGNKWLYHNTFESINYLGQKLQMLNIQNCNVQQESLSKLKNLQKLQTFVCGLNNIRGAHLAQLTKSCKNIKKLCIQGLNSYYEHRSIKNQQLLEIDRNCIRGLIYLNVFDCGKIDVPCLIKLRNLRVVVKQKLTKQEILELQRKGIIVS